MALDATPQYTIRATLADADLAQFAKENITGRQNLKGQVVATIDLGGTGRSKDTLRGDGKIRLRDAEIYELPIMVALLKILSVRAPDTTAFTKCDVDFHLQGDHVVLERINFSGDAISLMGQGQMNFDRQINLTFHSMVGDADVQLPFVRSFFGQASQQIMQIEVDGTVDQPITHSKAFPGVSQVFQQMKEDMQGPATPPANYPKTSKRPQDRPQLR